MGPSCIDRGDHQKLISLPQTVVGTWYAQRIESPSNPLSRQRQTLIISDHTFQRPARLSFEARFEGKYVEGFCANWEIIANFIMTLVDTPSSSQFILRPNCDSCSADNK